MEDNIKSVQAVPNPETESENVGDLSDLFGALFAGAGAIATAFTVPISENETPHTDKLLKILADDKAAGRDHLIDHFTIGTGMLANLLEEGTINVTHLTNALSMDGYIAVLSSVKVGDKEYVMRVANIAHLTEHLGGYACASMTADEKVV